MHVLWLLFLWLFLFPVLGVLIYLLLIVWFDLYGYKDED